MSQITIGRNPGSTIVVDSRYSTVSGSHATITESRGSVVFTDHSTNGSFVNGNRIQNSSVTLHRGDRVSLGRDYILNLDAVFSRLSLGAEPSYGHNPTMRMNNLQNQGYGYQNETRRNATPECLGRWNWGAFLFGWIWAICHGIYWPLVTLIPYIGWAASLIISIVLGVKGNEMAWAKFNGSAPDFDNQQEKWKKYGLIFILAVLVIAVLSTLIILTAFS